MPHIHHVLTFLGEGGPPPKRVIILYTVYIGFGCDTKYHNQGGTPLKILIAQNIYSSSFLSISATT